ncbi:hypothetical protein KSP40_PGU006557 [Platanthera guangdongensis]|uniref:Uncharacterized protein n=1 Tax=Platanthera guangdongensis TaxID=2320717 RepID=A0ABR2LDM6_9ASPA
MAEEKHHHYLFGHNPKEDEDTISENLTFTSEETHVGRDYAAKAAHGDIHDSSQTTEETDENYESEKYGCTQKAHLDEHEKHESDESGNGHKYPVEEEEKISVGVDSKVEEDEVEEAEEKKKHQLFGRD